MKYGDEIFHITGRDILRGVNVFTANDMAILGIKRQCSEQEKWKREVGRRNHCSD